MNAPKFIGNSTTPTIPGTTVVAGTGPTISVSGNDVAGVITFTVGTTPTTSGASGSSIFELSFSNAYTIAPVVLVNVIKTNGVNKELKPAFSRNRKA